MNAEQFFFLLVIIGTKQLINILKMKKNYVSPVMVVVNVMSSGMLAASVAAYRGPVGKSDDNGQSGNSGSWGNLWQ